MSRKHTEGVPALRNEDVAAMTPEDEERIIEKSGRASREEAAEAFYEEQEERARQDSNLGPTA